MTITRSPDAAREPSSDGASLETLRHLLALSARALAAVESGDVGDLDRVMAEREERIAAAGAGVQPPSGKRSGAAARGELLRVANQLRDADHRLSLALASRRDEFAHDLEALDSGKAARSAYQPSRRPRGQVNIVR